MREPWRARKIEGGATWFRGILPVSPQLAGVGSGLFSARNVARTVPPSPWDGCGRLKAGAGAPAATMGESAATLPRGRQCAGDSARLMLLAGSEVTSRGQENAAAGALPDPSSPERVALSQFPLGSRGPRD